MVWLFVGWLLINYFVVAAMVRRRACVTGLGPYDAMKAGLAWPACPLKNCNTCEKPWCMRRDRGLADLRDAAA